jgi:hypothetical protein
MAKTIARKTAAQGRFRSLVIFGAIWGFGLAGCASVQEKHLDRWTGQPIALLEGHPNLVTLPVVRTIMPDGTRLLRYVDGFDPLKCAEGNRIVSTDINFKTYERFSVCMGQKSACNHVFYIKNNVIDRYALIATGNALCRSSAKWSPGQRGSTY